MTRQPDITRIPNSLLSLEWLPVTPETEWYDGMVVLFAVPVSHRGHVRPDGNVWHYEFAVVSIHVYGEQHDENPDMSCEVEGDHWDRDPDDADWYVVIGE